MISIYEHFLALDKEKQQRILNAACSEFGRFGYKKTSAEQIAQSAAIAKGMVFHYFGSKLGLFDYLAQYARDFLTVWWGGLDEKLRDLDYIEQYRLVTNIKLEAYMANPYIFEFFTMLFTHQENLEVSEKIKAMYDTVMELRSRTLTAMATSMDSSRFRRDLDPEKAKQYVGWIIDGYANRLLAILGGQPLADMVLDTYWEEFDRILDDCKTLFYKQDMEG